MLEASEIEAKRKELAEALEEESDAASRAASLIQDLEDEGVDVSDIVGRFA